MINLMIIFLIIIFLIMNIYTKCSSTDAHSRTQWFCSLSSRRGHFDELKLSLVHPSGIDNCIYLLCNLAGKLKFNLTPVKI